MLDTINQWIRLSSTIHSHILCFCTYIVLIYCVFVSSCVVKQWLYVLTVVTLFSVVCTYCGHIILCCMYLPVLWSHYSLLYVLTVVTLFSVVCTYCGHIILCCMYLMWSHYSLLYVLNVVTLFSVVCTYCGHIILCYIHYSFTCKLLKNLIFSGKRIICEEELCERGCNISRETYCFLTVFME
jgi:uncharacterized Zn-finger protein